MRFACLMSSTSLVSQITGHVVLAGFHLYDNRVYEALDRHKQSWYMPTTLGASVTVPVAFSLTCTLIKARSVPQPKGAHPTVRNDPYASVSKNSNGMLCCSKKRPTSALFAPTLISLAASRLILSTWRASTAPRTLHRYSRIPNQVTTTSRTTTAGTYRCPLTVVMTPVSYASPNLRKRQPATGVQSVNS
jgi:hypothetical protein